MRWRSIFSVALGFAIMGPGLASGQDSRPGVGVWAFENGGSYGQDAQDFEASQVGLQQILITELARNSGLRIVERSRISEIISEQDLGQSGRVDPNTAARVGRIVGAKFMVLGSFIDLFGDFRIDVRIVDVETTEIIRTNRVADNREELYQMMVDLASRLTEDIDLPALENEAAIEEQGREIPTQAVTLYSRAIFFEDRGDKDRAIDLYSRALEQFPEYTEAQEALQQLRRG